MLLPNIQITRNSDITLLHVAKRIGAVHNFMNTSPLIYGFTHAMHDVAGPPILSVFQVLWHVTFWREETSIVGLSLSRNVWSKSDSLEMLLPDQSGNGANPIINTSRGRKGREHLDCLLITRLAGLEGFLLSFLISRQITAAFGFPRNRSAGSPASGVQFPWLRIPS